MATIDESRSGMTREIPDETPQAEPRRWRWTNEQFAGSAREGYFQDRRRRADQRGESSKWSSIPRMTQVSTSP